MTHTGPRSFSLAALAGLLALLAPAGIAHAVRLKDICTIEGVRENQLIGYGLVVGLDGTGDGRRAAFTPQALANFLRRNNLQLDVEDMRMDNVAMVIVEATLPPFARQGARIDVRVSAIGDAENLHGGTLLPTPLRPPTASPSAPGSVYAVAQGALSTGGFATGGRGGAGSSVVKNHPTTAMIPGGAIVEREVQTAFSTKPEFVLQLRNPDFTTARRIEQIINNTLGSGLAQALSAGAVSVRMPESGGNEERVRLLAEVENLQVSPDAPARVVYNERTGTIVMGGNVRISTAAITHGNLILRTSRDTRDVLSQTVGRYGETTVQARSEGEDREVVEEQGKFQVMDEGVTIGEVAEGLNALGVTARDIIAILQALKQCGALQAELMAM